MIVTVPLTVAPDAGNVMFTDGGVVSLDTVTVTGSDVQSIPRMSRATAVNVCEPLLAAVVFHATEYGAVVSSPPRLLPSTRNRTPATVSPPTIVTLALIVVRPDTVEPDAGDVMLTIRLPSCADPVGARIHIHASRTRAAAYASFAGDLVGIGSTRE